MLDRILSLSRKQPLSRRTTSTTAADEIRKKIFDGELRDGQPIRQDILAAELGISRTPIREALVQLEAEGLVRSEPHKGAVVAGLSPAEIEETFELRELLEPVLLRTSAPRLTEDDFAELASILKEYSGELRTRNVRRWGELNTAFHATLYARADRPQTQAMVARLLNSSDRYTRLQLVMTKGLRRAEAEHALIVDYCRKGQFDQAVDLLRAHIHHVKTELMRYVTKANKPKAGAGGK